MKTFLPQSLVLLGIALCTTACDCVQNVWGTVVDKETGQPLEGVVVYKETQEYVRCETNDSGSFALHAISGGLFRCPPMPVIVEKEGYESRSLKLRRASGKTIRLQRVSSSGESPE